jgi:hypothetical protein
LLSDWLHCGYWEGLKRRFHVKKEYLLELPEGKEIARLDTTNIFKAKEIPGNHVCIEGNMPVSIMQTGTAKEVRDYAKKLIDVAGKDGGYNVGARSSIGVFDPKLLKGWVDFNKEYGVYK